ncbi:MAG: LLM class F420-dependent oxidoreductase [Actinobacteria bacterium]|nr:MAG: LLM class F420-dependent oxidoreductase [Actinomycetota bacterium]REK40546.1 MAG: LLM class F420-dependent oxidoreductase [Actinomycetota bacterium]
MRFGAFVPQGWRHDLVDIPTEKHWETMTGVAGKIEELGFESLWVYDHFHTVPAPTQNVTYEAWTLMAALAVATDTVRIGQMCTCNTYRPPSYLAKVAASIDVISGGRLEMGIGAGWYEHEHDGYGYPFLKPSKRIGMLREGVEIMRAMWTEDVVRYDGDYYTLDGAICQPKPLQQPHIPMWIAGGGEQLTLNIAARHANYTNFGVNLDEFVHKSEVLAKHCADVGTDFDSIVRTSNFNVFCTETDADLSEKFDWYTAKLGAHLPADKVQTQASYYEDTSGTPEKLVSILREWKDAGLEYAIVNFADAAYDTSGMELFAKEVIPALSD